MYYYYSRIVNKQDLEMCHLYKTLVTISWLSKGPWSWHILVHYGVQSKILLQNHQILCHQSAPTNSYWLSTWVRATDKHLALIWNMSSHPLCYLYLGCFDELCIFLWLEIQMGMMICWPILMNVLVQQEFNSVHCCTN